MFFCRIFGVKCDRCGVVLSPHDLVSIVIIVVILAIIILAIIVVIITMTIAGDAHNGLYLSPWLLSMRYVRATIAGIIIIVTIIIVTIRSISISIAIIINNNVIIVIAFLLTMMRCGSL